MEDLAIILVPVLTVTALLGSLLAIGCIDAKAEEKRTREREEERETSKEATKKMCQAIAGMNADTATKAALAISLVALGMLYAAALRV